MIQVFSYVSLLWHIVPGIHQSNHMIQYRGLPPTPAIPSDQTHNGARCQRSASNFTQPTFNEDAAGKAVVLKWLPRYS